MSGMMRHQPPAEGAGVTQVAQELSQRGWQAEMVSGATSGVDLNVAVPGVSRAVAVRVIGNPRFDRRGQPEWLIGVWKFQSRPRTETGLPFFRHPFYPGFWVLWDFPTPCDVAVFVWPQEGQDARPRFFVSSTGELRQLLSETPAWAENYHGVRDRACWVGLEAIGGLEERWDRVEDMGG
jgi:hypothetical protein